MAMACSKSPYQQLEGQFPEIEVLPRDFKFDVEGVAAPLETTLIEGTVRPIGKIRLENEAVMLIVNDWNGEEPQWGDLTGYIFKDEKLIEQVLLARDFSQSYRYSILSKEMDLRAFNANLNPDTGEEEESEELVNLNELIK